jgi:hypothetical protein
LDGVTYYVASDVVNVLSETSDAGQYWDDLKTREPSLAGLIENVEFPNVGTLEAVTAGGVLRLVQSIPSRKAERIKGWLARSARERLEEVENPELAALRTRRLYERRGYSPRWVDKRLGGVSARQELTGEWFKRGATESDDFRKLTNELMRAAFGHDVVSLRNFKRLTNTGENLRDHMSDLELALTVLAETVAVNLHRTRDSRGVGQLIADARDAGEIAAKTMREIEARSGRPILTESNHRAWWIGRKPRTRAIA